MAYREIEISASVMCMDWLHLYDQLLALEQLNIDLLHFDLMDGVFVPEFSLGPLIVKKIRKNTTIPSDYHVMVEEPRRIFEQFVGDDGAYFSIHYEACRNLHRELVSLRKLNFKPGIVLNPATTLENIEYVIEEVSKVTIMTVNPGYVGQKMVSQTLNKVKKLNEWRNKYKYDLKIAVDGNVSFENVPKMIAAGADVLVVGTSGLFVKNQSLEESYEQLILKIDEGMEMKE
jgi:ribulose-phosphate 3-epimerase